MRSFESYEEKEPAPEEVRPEVSPLSPASASVPLSPVSSPVSAVSPLSPPFSFDFEELEEDFEEELFDDDEAQFAPVHCDEDELADEEGWHPEPVHSEEADDAGEAVVADEDVAESADDDEFAAASEHFDAQSVKCVAGFLHASFALAF